MSQQEITVTFYGGPLDGQVRSISLDQINIESNRAVFEVPKILLSVTDTDPDKDVEYEGLTYEIAEYQGTQVALWSKPGYIWREYEDFSTPLTDLSTGYTKMLEMALFLGVNPVSIRFGVLMRAQDKQYTASLTGLVHTPIPTKTSSEE